MDNRTPFLDSILVFICLVVGILLVFSPFFVKAQTPPSQLLNNTLFPTVDRASDFSEAITPIGYVATGTPFTGVQLMFNNPNQTVSSGIGVQIYYWLSEEQYNSCGFSCAAGQIGSYTGNLVTDESGFANIPLSVTSDFQGFPYFYGILIFPNSPGINPGFSPVTNVLGTNLSTGATTYYKAGLTATSTNTQFYFQVYNGDPVQYFTPSPNYAGIATSSVGTLCDNSFATSTGWLDSIGSSISNGLCRVGVFLFVPNQSTVSGFSNNWQTLTTSRFPFSWITDAREILESYAATSTENFPSLTIHFGTSTALLGFENLEVISTSTLSHYMSDGTRNTIKLLLTAVFYLTAMSFIYRDLQRIWHKQV